MARSPLFDYYDPYGVLEQQAQLGLLPTDEDDVDEYGLPTFSRRRVTLSDLMPAEEKSSLLNTLAQTGASGLSTAGWLLDTPGAMLRGLLAEGPGKALSALWDSSDERVSGRDLLRAYDLAGNEDNWGNFAGGMAAEMLLDPLLLVNPAAILGRGALTPAGKALRATGLLRNPAVEAYQQGATRGSMGVREFLRSDAATPAALLNQADPAMMDRWRHNAIRFGVDPDDLTQRAAALMDVRVPGTNLGWTIGEAGGTGTMSQVGDYLARSLDTLGEASKSAPGIGPIVSGARALLTADAGGAMDPAIQWRNRVARNTERGLREAADALRTRQLYDAMNAQVPDVMPDGTPIPAEYRQFNSRTIQNALTDFVESPDLLGPTPSGVPLGRTSYDPLADWVLENVPEFRAIRDDMADLGPDWERLAADTGLALPTWQGGAGENFFPRQLKQWLDQQRPERANAAQRAVSPYSQGDTLLGLDDNFGRGRREYTDIPGASRTFRRLTGGDANFDARQLQDALLAATDPEARRLMRQSFDMLGVERPYREQVRRMMAGNAYQNATPAQRRTMLRNALEGVRDNETSLVDLLRDADRQFADTGTGLFDTNAFDRLRRYESGRLRVTANNAEVINALAESAIPTRPSAVAGGGVQTVTDAAVQLGYDRDNFRAMWQRTQGTNPDTLAVPDRLVQSLETLSVRPRVPEAEAGLMGAIQQFTNAFKVSALANPAFHTRNLYSGEFSNVSFGMFNPLDQYAAYQASQGNYAPLAGRLQTAPGYQNLSDAERIREFLAQTGGNRIAGGTVLDDMSIPEEAMRSTYTGGQTETLASTFGNLRGQTGRSWLDFFNDFASLRGVGITRAPRPYNTNPLLQINDAAGSAVEDTLRTGGFLTQIRRGTDPGAAADAVRMAQLDYSPQSFSDFERRWLKKIVPFYSFQRRIIPQIADRLLYQPGGLQGQSIRAISRASEPNEENFVPEHLRQTAAIPLPEIFGGQPAEGLQRYLTNIDLPFESTLNLFTPGTGGTAAAAFADTIAKTGSNILGQTTPLIKAPIEYATNRQLYSGRDLSELYSVLEQGLGPIGRPLEQAAINFLPFGSRAISTYRQLTDDRLTTPDALMKTAFNLLAGLKLSDVDENRARQQAARQVLNSMLSTTPGVRTYENITVPEDSLERLTPEQRQLYLLYRVIQSDAAKRARQRQQDPMELLLGR